jgi:hypothetical protein
MVCQSVVVPIRSFWQPGNAEIDVLPKFHLGTGRMTHLATPNNRDIRRLRWLV